MTRQNRQFVKLKILVINHIAWRLRRKMMWFTFFLNVVIDDFSNLFFLALDIHAIIVVHNK